MIDTPGGGYVADTVPIDAGNADKAIDMLGAEGAVEDIVPLNAAFSRASSTRFTERPDDLPAE
jgi:hypothetical protein